MRRYDRSFFKSYNQGDQSEATIHPSIDFIKKTISKLVTILSKDTRQITERGKVASESKRIINVPEDIVDVIRKVEYFKEAIKNTEVPTIEELKARLEDLERDMPCVSEFDEPVATRLGFEDDLFTYMSEIDLREEDEALIRIATNHPAYKSFARSYCRHEPDADEIQIVKAFVRSFVC